MALASMLMSDSDELVNRMGAKVGNGGKVGAPVREWRDKRRLAAADGEPGAIELGVMEWNCGELG